MNITSHPLYDTWGAIVQRTSNPNHTAYHRYGGRGITLCDEWYESRVFCEQVEALLGPRPDGMTLDRMDNNGNYEPGNVRWATPDQQQDNARKDRTFPIGKHGFKYVGYDRRHNRYRGQFRYKGKLYQTPNWYTTPEAAHQAAVTLRHKVVTP